MFKNILVAVDGSQAATSGLETAVELCQKLGAGLHLLHVVREMQVPSTMGLMAEYESLQRQRHDMLKSAGEQMLNQAKRAAQSKGVDSVDTDIGSGDPANAIVKYAGQKGIDLIVMGSRGLGEVEGMLLGSVSRKVSNTAKVTCMIIK